MLDPRRRSFRPRPAPPAARPGGPWRGRESTASSSPIRTTRRRRRASRPSPLTTTASSWPSWTSSCGRRASCSACTRAACRACGSRPSAEGGPRPGRPGSRDRRGARRTRPAALRPGNEALAESNCAQAGSPAWARARSWPMRRRGRRRRRDARRGRAPPASRPAQPVAVSAGRVIAGRPGDTAAGAGEGHTAVRRSREADPVRDPGPGPARSAPCWTCSPASGAGGIEALSRGAARRRLRGARRRRGHDHRREPAGARPGAGPWHRRADGRGAYLHERAAADGPFDVVLVDPPYADTKALDEAAAHSLAPSAGAPWPRTRGSWPSTSGARRRTWTVGLLASVRTKRFGETALTLYRLPGHAAEASAGDDGATDDAGTPATTSDRGGGTVRIAVYPGLVRPHHLRPLDVLRRAAAVFDRIAIAVLVNRGKTTPLLPARRAPGGHPRGDRRVAARRTSPPGSRSNSFDGLTVDFCRKRGATFVVRGLRAISDFESELQMAHTNRKLAPEVDTVFFMTALEHSYLSSSLVKEIAAFGGRREPDGPARRREAPVGARSESIIEPAQPRPPKGGPVR